MELDLPDSFGPGYDQKYVLLAVGERRVVVSKPLRFHSQIVAMFEEEEGRLVQVLGGGILSVSEEGVVSTYGSSGGYGPVSEKELQVVKKCLAKQKLPLGQIVATDYIRE